MTPLSDLRHDLAAIVHAALETVNAGALVRAALEAPDVVRAVWSASAVDVVAVGKAARPMLLALPAALGQVAVRHVIGISNQSGETLSSTVRWLRTTHPVPDERSIAAAQVALDMARTAGERDLLLVLLSGGASAMVALPAPGISLQDKQRTSAELLRRGAEIHALNTVRKHLSAIKGGQLAAASPASVLTLAVSDVVGDDPSAIGSGPTVPDLTTFADALEVLRRHGGTDAYPPLVVQRLVNGANGDIPETPKAQDPRLARSTMRVIGGARTAVNGARAAAEARGYVVHVIDEPVTGEARRAGDALLETASQRRVIEGNGRPLCILAAGETTVQVVGSGRGGRNQECALGMARRLAAFGSPAVAASVGTDGVDGPTDAAGAVVDTKTVSRAAAAGLAVSERYLENNDSYTFFAGLGDLFRTGPTDTNVGDLQVILVG